MAKDGLSVYVHASNPLGEITMEQLKAVYTGKQATGSTLGAHGSVTGINFEYFDDEKERDHVRALLVQ